MVDEVFLTTCPACGTMNRIPAAKVAAQGRCGRCHATLPARTFFSDTPVGIGEAHFDLVTRFSPLPVLADFWASWCQPCQIQDPILEQIATELRGRLLVIKVNADAAPMLSDRFAIRSIPSLLVLRSGIEVDRIVGVLPLPALRAKVERFLT